MKSMKGSMKGGKMGMIHSPSNMGKMGSKVGKVSKKKMSYK